jgi:hypothetical protein
MPTDASAKDDIRKAILSGQFGVEISKSFKAVEKISEMDYRFYSTEERGNAELSQEFSTVDAQIMTWNLYHEARGEPEEGQLSVMLSTLNRMRSKNFPRSVGGVVFQRFAYSWILAQKKFSTIVDDINTQVENKQTKRIDIEKYDERKFRRIQEMVNRFMFLDKDGQVPNNLGNAINLLKSELIRKYGIRVSPDKLDKTTTYHKSGMLHMNNFLKEIKTVDTFRRVAYLEYLASIGDYRVFKVGTQIYYSDTIRVPLISEWKVPAEYKSELPKTKINPLLFDKI